jgi:hypothetical protein
MLKLKLKNFKTIKKNIKFNPINLMITDKIEIKK